MDNFKYASGILVLILAAYMSLMYIIADLKSTIKEQNQQIIELLQNKE